MVESRAAYTRNLSYCAHCDKAHISSAQLLAVRQLGVRAQQYLSAADRCKEASALRSNSDCRKHTSKSLPVRGRLPRNAEQQAIAQVTIPPSEQKAYQTTQTETSAR